MAETGRVCAIDGRIITVRQDKFGLVGSEACFGCMNAECKSREGFITAVNALNLPVKPGQQVETELQGGALWKEAPAIIAPAAGFAAGFIITGPAAGVLLMFAAGAAFFLYRLVRPSRTKPIITRIV